MKVMLQWTNLLIKIDSDGEGWYFRFCPPHASICSYIRYFFDVFELICVNNELLANENKNSLQLFFSCIDTWLKQEKNAAKVLLSLPKTLSRVNKTVWGSEHINLDESELTAIGLPVLPEEVRQFMPSFVKLLVVLVSGYRKNCFVPRNVCESGNYAKFRASYELAKKLETPWLTSMPILTTIQIGKTFYNGFICKDLGLPATKQPKIITGELQRQLSILNMFDVITGERDHGPNNYALISGEGGTEKKICCFDNDGDDAFTMRTSIDCERAFMSSQFVKRGEINRLYLDKEFAERVCELRFFDLFSTLDKHVSPILIIAIFIRLQKTKRAIRVASAKRPLLIDSNNWNMQSIGLEINGVEQYGKTYLNVYDEKCRIGE